LFAGGHDQRINYYGGPDPAPQAEGWDDYTEMQAVLTDLACSFAGAAQLLSAFSPIATSSCLAPSQQQQQQQQQPQQFCQQSQQQQQQQQHGDYKQQQGDKKGLRDQRQEDHHHHQQQQQQGPAAKSEEAESSSYAHPLSTHRLEAAAAAAAAAATAAGSTQGVDSNNSWEAKAGKGAVLRPALLLEALEVKNTVPFSLATRKTGARGGSKVKVTRRKVVVKVKRKS